MALIWFDLIYLIRLIRHLICWERWKTKRNGRPSFNRARELASTGPLQHFRIDLYHSSDGQFKSSSSIRLLDSIGGLMGRGWTVGLEFRVRTVGLPHQRPYPVLRRPVTSHSTGPNHLSSWRKITLLVDRHSISKENILFLNRHNYFQRLSFDKSIAEFDVGFEYERQLQPAELFCWWRLQRAESCVWIMNLLMMILNYGGHVKPLY